MWTIVLICVVVVVVGNSNALPLFQSMSTMSDQVVRYDNHKVYRFTPQTNSELKLLSTLENQYPGQVNFWQRAGKVGQPVDVMVSPGIQSKVFSDLQSSTMSGETPFIENVQELIDKQRKADAAVISKFPSLSWHGYYDYEDILDFLDEQVKIHPKIASLKTYGHSFERRPLKVIKISKGGNGKRPIIFIDANIHAREWITGAVATYVINELLNGGDSTGVQSLLNTFDFHIAPMLNPDGYEYSREVNRMWRKTRSDYNGPLCRGADPNRNFGYKWNTGGTSDNCFHDTYRGGKAFSERETHYISQYYSKIQHRTVAYLSLHAYSQLILIPWGTKIKGKNRIRDFENHMRVANLMQSAMAKRYGTKFKPGNIVDILYVASGGSGDWVKGTYNTTLTYTFELRDTGQYGFLLPADQIVPSALEFIDGLIALAEDLKEQLGLEDEVKW